MDYKIKIFVKIKNKKIHDFLDNVKIFKNILDIHEYITDIFRYYGHLMNILRRNIFPSIIHIDILKY